LPVLEKSHIDSAMPRASLAGDAKRRILLAGMNYRGYDTRICSELQAQGFSCTQLAFRGKAPNAGYNLPVLGALAHAFSARGREPHCRAFMNEIDAQLAAGSFDAVLLVNPVFLLERSWISRPWPATYVWLMDPVWRYPQFKEAIALARKSFSYDAADCARYGLEELPLFSIAARPGLRFAERETDFCFIGGLYLERLPALERIVQFCRQQRRSFRFLGDLHAFAKKARPVIDRLYPALMKSFEISSLSPEQCLDLYSRSRCVVNFHAAGHHGFSMRTFEALSCGANVLTELQPTGVLAEYFSDRLRVLNSGAKLTDELLRRCLEQDGPPPASASLEALGLGKRLDVLKIAIEGTAYV
jgi:hypothetical protein